MVDLRKSAAIVGAYEHPTRYAPDKSALQIQGESAIKALEDAGLSKKDVDGLFTSGTGRLSGLTVADYLNLDPRYIDNTSLGGASFEFHLSHAVTAIAAGRIDVALITYGNTPRSSGEAVGTGGFSRFGAALPDPAPDSFEEIYGPTIVALYAMIAQRHMYKYGTTSEQLAEIAVACRKHASMNPNALYRDPITISDVAASRLVSPPLHVLDCCVISDGGGAIVVGSPKVAQQSKKTPVWVLGMAEGAVHQGNGKRDLVYMAAQKTGVPALEMAGVSHDDIDMCMVYDSFTITALVTLEDLGFCRKGEGGSFVSGGRLQLGGALPMNTDGGGLSSNHPGMRGMFLLIEATRQLRHERGEAQVADCGLALCHGTGGTLGSRHSGSTIILGRD